LNQIKLTGNRRPTFRHSGGGGHSLEILPRAREIIDPPLYTNYQCWYSSINLSVIETHYPIFS